MIPMFDRSNNTIGFVKISQGGMTGTVVDVIIICKYAIDLHCSAVIMSHNHPLGNSNQSPQDVQISIKLKEALKYIDVSLLDCLIQTADGYISFAGKG